MKRIYRMNGVCRVWKGRYKTPIYSLRSPGGAGKCGRFFCLVNPGRRTRPAFLPGATVFRPSGALIWRWREGCRFPKNGSMAERIGGLRGYL